MADNKAYHVVFHEDSDDAPLRFWVPGSPVQLVATQVFRSTATSKAYLQFKVRNVSGTSLDRLSWEADVALEDGMSDQIGGDEIDLGLTPDAERTFGPIALPHELVREAAVELVRVSLGDGTTWELPDPKPETPTLEVLSLGSEAAAERFRQIRDAGIKRPDGLRYKRIDGGSWWVCSCGAANVRRETCHKCGIQKDDLPRLEDEKALQEIAKERGERRSGMAKKTLRCAIIAVVAVALVVVARVFWTGVVSPMLRYNDAVAKMDAGQYGDAIDEFTELEGFRDSADRVEEARGAMAEAGEACYAVVMDTHHFGSSESASKGETLVNEIAYGNGSITSTKSYNVVHGVQKDTYSSRYACDRSGIPISESTNSGREYDIQVDDYDDGQPTKLTESESGSARTTSISIEYYGKGKIKTVTSEGGVGWRAPATGSEVLNFNEDGTLASREFALTGSDGSTGTSNDTYEYEYDDQGRAVACTHHYEYASMEGSNEHSSETLSFEYNDYGKLSKAYRNGQLSDEYEYEFIENPSDWLLIQSALSYGQVGYSLFDLVV